MNRPLFLNRMIMSVLAAGCMTSGYMWVKERARSEQSRSELELARAEIGSLKKSANRNPDAVNDTNKREATPPQLSVRTPPEPVIVSPGSGELHVMPVAVDQNQGQPPLSDNAINAIEQFDRAMDREFDRLDEREAGSDDKAEVTTIQKIKDQLIALDDLYRRVDTAASDDERMAIRQEMQKTMGDIIGLSRLDRNERLAGLATQVGYNDPEAIESFVREIDLIYRETHMDWTKLFNRGPPPATGTPSPGPGAPSASPASEP